MQGVLEEDHTEEHGEQVHLQDVDGELPGDPGDQGEVPEVQVPGLCQGRDGGGPGHGRQGEAEQVEAG